eukprot:3897376-Prymnesium_polylepis.1
MHEPFVASAHPWWNPPVEMSAMVMSVATVAAHAVHNPRRRWRAASSHHQHRGTHARAPRPGPPPPLSPPPRGGPHASTPAPS